MRTTTVHTIVYFALTAALALNLLAADRATVVKHVTVYSEQGRYGGWPANHGMWSWGNEIVVGFSRSYFQLNDFDGHPYDRKKGEPPALARSRDGGERWTIEEPPSLRTPTYGGKEPVELKEPMDFTRPGFAMTIRFLDSNKGPSLMFYSYDRCKTWNGPFKFPVGELGVLGRTDYIVNGKRDALVFLAASKTNGREGRPFCARTTDGGLHWNLVSWIGPEPREGFSIMPSTVRLSKTGLLTTFRHEDSLRKGPNWIDAYRSSDDGRTWEFAGRAAEDTGVKSGNPPALVRLKDGRIVVSYGYRSEPYSIRARISKDNGATWGDVIMLRDDAKQWDVGYCRAVVRPDGKIVVLYYWVPEKDQERTIEATIWDPGNGKDGAKGR